MIDTGIVPLPVSELDVATALGKNEPFVKEATEE
jgi:hypothetical protein